MRDIKRLLNKDIDLLTEELLEKYSDTRVLTDFMVVDRIELMKAKKVALLKFKVESNIEKEEKEQGEDKEEN
ncbi:MAG: hypothetical protein M3299_05850 [Thermoproteota archaeon]|nr:hypothetical protein [Thermoproteota archaeon]